MVTANNPNQNRTRESAWARPVERLKVEHRPEEAIGINVDGRELTGPIRGFGPLWQKTYKVRLAGCQAGPAEVIREWKANFPRFWPKNNKFYPSLCGIEPGEVALLDLGMPGGMKLATGVMVIYSDEESFTFMTPQGHMLSAWITFSAYEENGCTVAQAQAILRASDPLSELGLRLGGHKVEDRHWQHTLRSLARHMGVPGQVETTAVCLDPRFQWSEAKNVWHSTAIRTPLYLPVRFIRRLLKQ
jgi:hypothetical protein